MTKINRDALAKAAEQGEGIEHLTPAQAWAAHHLNIAPEHLKAPLPHLLVIYLASEDQKARGAFFGSVQGDDVGAMIRAAHDDRHPAHLRNPILETLQEGMREFFPGLKPTVVDDAGNPLFNLADLARELDASEDEMLALAEEKGIVDQIHTGNVNPIH